MYAEKNFVYFIWKLLNPIAINAVICYIRIAQASERKKICEIPPLCAKNAYILGVVHKLRWQVLGLFWPPN